MKSGVVAPSLGNVGAAMIRNLGSIVLVVALASATGACTSTGMFSRLQSLDNRGVYGPNAYESEAALLTARSEQLRIIEPYVHLGTGAGESALFQIQLSVPQTAQSNADAGSPQALIGETIGLSTPINPVPLTPQRYTRLLQNYVEARVQQVDRLCDAYFDELQSLAGTMNFGRSTANSLADFGLSAMGLYGAPAEQLALLSAGRAGANAVANAAELSLFISPEPSLVRGLIEARQEQMLSQHPTSGISRHSEAEAFVRRYAATCMPVGIRQIVNDAINRETEVRSTDARSPEAVSFLDSLRTVINFGAPEAEAVSGLTLDDAAHLVWLLELPRGCFANARGEDCELWRTVAGRLPGPLSEQIQRTQSLESIRTILMTARLNWPGLERRFNELRTSYRTEQEAVARQRAEADAEAQRLQQLRDATPPENVSPPPEPGLDPQGDAE